MQNTFKDFSDAARDSGITLHDAEGSIGTGYSIGERCATVYLLAFHDGEVIDLHHGEVALNTTAAMNRACEDLLDPYRDLLARTWELASALDDARQGGGNDVQAISDECVTAA